MDDRIPTRPGRMLLTPENGAAPFYATLERADQPTQAGTQLNKNSLLKDDTAALYGLGSDAVPDDVLAMLKPLVDSAQNSADARAKIQAGSYVGTGTYGESHPNSLTFDFEPVMMAFFAADGTLSQGRYQYYDYPHIATLQSLTTNYQPGCFFNYGGSLFLVKKSSDGKTIYWYTDSAIFQLNESGKTYKYIAIG